MKDFKVAVILPDIHVPFHDQKALALVMKVITHLNKNVRPISWFQILGDFLDFYGLNSYGIDPDMGDMAELYDLEIAEGNNLLNGLDEVMPKTKKCYLEGNHEFRLQKYLKQNGGALRNRLTVPNELGFEKRSDWTWVPYNHLQSQQIDNSPLYARHEPFGSSAAKTQAAKAGASFIYGHTHGIDEGEFICKLNGQRHIAINSGCLVNMNAPVFNYVKSRPNWSHAFTIVYYNKNSFTHQLIRIEADYTCIFDGKRFKA